MKKSIIQKKFIERFNELISILENKGNPLIPWEQLCEIEYNPRFSPQLDPQPMDAFSNSFDWYLNLPLIPGGEYGPFYRVDGPRFWPLDSDGKNESSEAKYFYGLQRPRNQQEAEKMYGMMSTTPRTHVHTIIIDSKTLGKIYGARIFLGPVKNGTGYQFNANIATAEIIRSLLVRDKVPKTELIED